jgi:hypothetical protein
MTIRLRFAFLLLFGLATVSLTGAAQSPHLTRQQISNDLFSATLPAQPMQQAADNLAPSKKSVGLAALYSLLVPGMGELYAEGFGSGKYFLIAEGGLWITYAAFEIHGNDLRDGARSFAAARAGVSLGSQDDQFFVDLGNFLTMDEYNDKRLRDREPEKLYSAGSGQYWRWDSEDSRLTYREQRISSEDMYNNRKFVGAAIIINHVVSAINAARAAISYNSSLEKSLGSLELSSRVLGGPGGEHGVLVTLSRKF